MATIAKRTTAKKQGGFWRTLRGVTRELLTMPDTEAERVETQVLYADGNVIEVRAASMAEASRLAQGYTVAGGQMVITRTGRNRYEIRVE